MLQVREDGLCLQSMPREWRDIRVGVGWGRCFVSPTSAQRLLEWAHLPAQAELVRATAYSRRQEAGSANRELSARLPGRGGT